MAKTVLYLNSRDEFMRIDISKIVYFEADGNYTNIILSNSLKGVVCMNLAQMQKCLSEKLREQASIFVRIGRKYIINHSFVFLINPLTQKLILSDGEKFIYELKISKDALKQMKDLYSADNQSYNL